MLRVNIKTAVTTFLGKISYSLYLYHEVFGLWLIGALVRVAKFDPLQSFAVSTCVTIMFAYVMYALVERPAIRMAKTLVTFEPRRSSGASALRTAAQTASVSLRTKMKPAVLRRALSEGYVSTHAVARVGTLLDEAPPSLLVRLVDEVSTENHLAPAIVWDNRESWLRGS